MSLILFEGFDNINALTDKYGVYDTSNYIFLSGTTRTSIGKSLNIGAGSTNARFSIYIPTANTYYIGCAIRFSSFSGNSSNYLMSFESASGSQNAICIDATGHIVVYRYSTQIGISTSTLSPNIWYYIEVKCTIANSISAGDYSVKVNNIEWVSLSATTDTQYQTDSGLSVVRLSNSHSVSNVVLFDDLYISNSAFLGDCRVLTCRPSGNGTTSNFVGSDSDSTDNYALVDDSTLDSADYVKSSTVDHVDLYTLADLPINPGAIYGVNVTSYIDKMDSGPRSLQHIVRPASTNRPGTAFYPSFNGAMANYTTLFETNPEITAAWTSDAINTMEVGVKITS